MDLTNLEAVFETMAHERKMYGEETEQILNGVHGEAMTTALGLIVTNQHDEAMLVQKALEALGLPKATASEAAADRFAEGLIRAMAFAVALGMDAGYRLAQAEHLEEMLA